MTTKITSITQQKYISVFLTWQRIISSPAENNKLKVNKQVRCMIQDPARSMDINQGLRLVSKHRYNDVCDVPKIGAGRAEKDSHCSPVTDTACVFLS